MITIEEINGKKCSVVRKPFDAEWVREQLAIGMPVVVEAHQDSGYRQWITLINEADNSLFGYVPDSTSGLMRFSVDGGGTLQSIIVVLPALPRHPTPEHAGLMYRYMAEGIEPQTFCCATGKRINWLDNVHRKCSIIRALYNGQRIEISIEGVI